MVISDLYSAGCPDGSRLSEDPSDEEAAERIEQAIDYLPTIQNTSCYFALKIILHDLFDWDQPITHENWRELDQRIREYSSRDGRYDSIFTYSLEWSFFTRAQWGRFDTALIELEHSWNHDAPCPPLPVTLTPDLINFKKKIRTLEDIETALQHYFDKTPFDKIITIASHLSTDIHYRHVSPEEMSQALAKRETAGPTERDIYANYIFNRYLEIYETSHSDMILQFSTDAEPLPFETGSKMPSETIFELAHVFAEHPSISFNLHVSNAATNQALCTLARELPNFSLNGYWWHNFFPSFIKPADVLWDKIEFGQYDEDTALEIAQELFYGSAAKLFKVQ